MRLERDEVGFFFNKTERRTTSYTRRSAKTVRQDRAYDQKDHGKYRRYVTKEGFFFFEEKEKDQYRVSSYDSTRKRIGNESHVSVILSSSERFYHEKCRKVKLGNKISQTGSSSENCVHEFLQSSEIFVAKTVQTHEKRPRRYYTQISRAKSWHESESLFLQCTDKFLSLHGGEKS